MAESPCPSGTVRFTAAPGATGSTVQTKTPCVRRTGTPERRSTMRPCITRPGSGTGSAPALGKPKPSHNRPSHATCNARTTPVIRPPLEITPFTLKTPTGFRNASGSAAPDHSAQSR